MHLTGGYIYIYIFIHLRGYTHRPKHVPVQALGAQAPLLDVAENSQRAAPHEACGAQIRGRVQLKVQRVLRVWNDFPLGVSSSRPNVLEGLIALSCTGSGVRNKQTCIHSGLTPKSKGPKSCAKHMSSNIYCFWFWWLAPDPEGKGAGHP